MSGAHWIRTQQASPRTETEEKLCGVRVPGRIRNFTLEVCTKYRAVCDISDKVNQVYSEKIQTRAGTRHSVGDMVYTDTQETWGT